MLGKPNVDQNPAPAPDRRTVRRDATKVEILDAAWVLAREQGLAALSLRELAAAVGMRAPSLYQYFASKHAIYDAMFKQAAEAALGLDMGPHAGEDARTAMRHAAHTFFDFATADPVRTQLLFQRTLPGFEPSPEAYAPAVAFLQHTQSRLAAIGITDPDAVDLWTALSSGLINQQIANDPGGNRWGRLVDRAVDMFLAEVAPTKKGKR